MKTNRVQQHICDFIIEHVQWWRDSNDINSPTHYYDLESRLNELVEDEGWINKHKAHELGANLLAVLDSIRAIKED